MDSPVLDPKYLGRIMPGMDVCDIGGDKVGSVAHVYHYENLPEGQAPPGEEFFEVKSGLFGLGHHYYFPMSAVQEIVGECVFLSKAKEQFESLGWDQKPPHFDALH
ncbi:MAG: DUF2171 domain-containing protein [Chloroflexota bacterium]|nr:DUF2171 domain-containing protein [Chloroflexota bacterium]